MGDHGYNRHGLKTGEGCCAPFVGELGPRLTHCTLGQGLLPYQVASSFIQPFGPNRHGPKTGGRAPIRVRELGPHVTQCGLGQGLPPNQVTSWSMQPFGRNRHGQKIGGLRPRFREETAGSPSNKKVPSAEAYLYTKWHLDASSRLATIEISRKLGRGLRPLL